MPEIRQIGLGYILIISLAAVIVTAADKVKSRRGRWRIPEATLFGVALIGGAAAMYVTMRLIRHKTRHRRFMWGLPLIILAQTGLVYWWIR